MALARVSKSLSRARAALPTPLPPHGRILAAESDFRTAAPLLELNERIAGGEAREAGGAAALALLADLRVKWAAAPLSTVIPFANDSMTIQLAELFQHLHDVDSGDAPAAPRLPRLPPGDARRAAAFTASVGPSSHTNPLPTLAFRMKALAAEARREAEADVRRQLQGRVGCALWTGPSQAAHAGRRSDTGVGVYLRGRAAPGAVVGLYPGAVYSGEMLQRAEDCGHLGDPTIQRDLVPRFDEAVIDCRDDGCGGAQGSALRPHGGGQSPQRRRRHGGGPEGEEEDGTSPPAWNPYALAHYVRHPPPGVSPNVMRLQVDFVDAGAASGHSTAPAPGDLMPFPPHLRSYIPNTWGALVSSGGALYSSLEQDIWMKGAVLIALRPLWDEELFVDLTLNPLALAAGTLPPWARAHWDARKEIRRLAGRVSGETAAAAREGQAAAAERAVREARAGGGGAPPRISGGGE